MSITELIIVALITAAGSIFVSFITSGLQLFKWKNGEKKKTEGDINKASAESALALTEAANKLIEPLNERIEVLEKELDLFKNKNVSLENEIASQEGRWNKKVSELEISRKKIKELTDQFNLREKEWLEKIDTLDKQWNEKFESLRLEYSEIQKELVIFKNWAERLVHQVYSLGAEPVPMILDTREDKSN